jgi:hypothetical protein
MQPNAAVPDLGQQFADLDYLLYKLENLCQFMEDLALSADAKGDLHQVKPEALGVTFSIVGNQVTAARRGLNAIRNGIALDTLRAGRA